MNHRAKKQRVRVQAETASTIGQGIVTALKKHNTKARLDMGHSCHRAYVRVGKTSLEINGSPERTWTPKGSVDVWRYTVFIGYGTRLMPRKRFPPRKNGHDFDAIALAAIAEAEAEQKRETYRQTRILESARLEEIRKQIIADYALDDLSAWLSVDEGKLRIDARNLTPDEARAIMRAWKAAKEKQQTNN